MGSSGNKKMNLSLQYLLRLVVVLTIGTLALAWKYSFLTTVYGAGNLSPLSYALNGLVLFLFIVGVGKIVKAYLHYSFEENQIALYLEERNINKENSILSLSPQSILYKRYMRIKQLYDDGIPINHGAIASIMVAEESRYLSFPKFVNNVLILTGVFGTIVSLILALIGAGSILKTSVAGEGMWLIINGMNTALTTTATAIVSYFLYTYFYNKLLDLQTAIFSKVEDVVMRVMIADFVYEQDEVDYRSAKAIEQLTETVAALSTNYAAIERAIEALTANQAEMVERFSYLQSLSSLETLVNQQKMQSDKADLLYNKLDELSQLMRKGFRLD